MKPHKWAKEIKAWADGAEIEFRIEGGNEEWREIETSSPSWHKDNEYRIKPQPKEPQYLYVYKNEKMEGHIALSDITRDTEYKYIGKIKLEQDDERH